MQLLPAQRAHFGAERRDLIVFACRRVTRGEETSEAEKDDRREGEQQGRNQSSGHTTDSKFGNCSPRSFAIGDTMPPAPLSLGTTCWDGGRVTPASPGVKLGR